MSRASELRPIVRARSRAAGKLLVQIPRGSSLGSTLDKSPLCLFLTL